MSILSTYGGRVCLSLTLTLALIPDTGLLVGFPKLVGHPNVRFLHIWRVYLSLTLTLALILDAGLLVECPKLVGHLNIRFPSIRWMYLPLTLIQVERSRSVLACRQVCRG